SRCVGVVSSLLTDKRDDFVGATRREYEKLRETQKTRDITLLTIEEARRRKPLLDYGKPSRPTFFGVRTYDDFPLDRIEPFVDWTEFRARRFHRAEGHPRLHRRVCGDVRDRSGRAGGAIRARSRRLQLHHDQSARRSPGRRVGRGNSSRGQARVVRAGRESIERRFGG